MNSKYEEYLQTEQFDKLRQTVLLRDHNRCVICGSISELQIHHLTYRNVYHENTQDLITLCRKCHATYHAIEKKKEAVEEIYLHDIKTEKSAREKEWEDIKLKNERDARESDLVVEEIKADYLDSDYCRNGDLDLMDWGILNAIIGKKCKEHNIEYFSGGKNELRNYFLYRRCEFFLRCIDKKISLNRMIKETKFNPQWLEKWYRADKCKSKLSEEKFKEDILK